MPEENPKIFTRFIGRELTRHVDCPEGMIFLAQIFVGRGGAVMARVNAEFPFDKLNDGALDRIAEAIRRQLHFVEELKKKQRAAQNS